MSNINISPFDCLGNSFYLHVFSMDCYYIIYTYGSGTVTGLGWFLRYSLNRSSKACPIVVITSSAKPPPHSST